jgi:DNA-binding GntR family transcriptional regulator
VPHRLLAHVRRPFALTSLHDDLVKAGRSPHTRVLDMRSVQAAVEVAVAVQVPEESRVLRLVDGEPIARRACSKSSAGPLC